MSTRINGKAAQTMLGAFESVGAESFDLTITRRGGEKVRFQRQQPYTRLREIMATCLEAASRQEHNVIVRPHSGRAVFIQLDDLDHDAAERIRPAAFLSLQTSPANYQAWVALPRMMPVAIRILPAGCAKGQGRMTQRAAPPASPAV